MKINISVLQDYQHMFSNLLEVIYQNLRKCNKLGVNNSIKFLSLDLACSILMYMHDLALTHEKQGSHLVMI